MTPLSIAYVAAAAVCLAFGLQHVVMALRVEDRKLEQLLHLCQAHRGDTVLVLCLICATGEIAFVQPQKSGIRNTTDFRKAVKDIFGEQCLLEKADKTRREGDGTGVATPGAA